MIFEIVYHSIYWHNEIMFFLFILIISPPLEPSRIKINTIKNNITAYKLLERNKSTDDLDEISIKYIVKDKKLKFIIPPQNLMQYSKKNGIKSFYKAIKIGKKQKKDLYWNNISKQIEYKIEN